MSEEKKSLQQYIYELSALEANIMLKGGELTEDEENQLVVLDEKIPAKVDAYQYFLKKLDNDIKTMDDQVKFYQTGKKALKNLQDRIKERLLYIVQSRPDKKLEGESVILGVAKNPPKLEITDENLIPDAYKIIVQETKIDNEKIKEDLKQGLPINGTELTQSERLKFTVRSSKK